MPWHQAATMTSRRFVCGFCGNLVASPQGYHMYPPNSYAIYICPHCHKPTFFQGDSPTPGVPPGAEVSHLPYDIEALYREARRSVSVGAHTASVLTCRKLLMNIAVSQGAAEGLRFIEYIDFLAAKGFVPPNGRAWVDHIRTKGNEATHEIVVMGAAESNDLLTFMEMLLKFIYEFPMRVPKPVP